jgi:hypothetical protein
MKHLRLAGSLALMLLSLPAFGQAEPKVAVIAPQPIAQRVATSDAVVVGKVTSIEEKPVAALPFPGSARKAEYQIAVVKIEDPILGAKGLTHLRIGFVPAQPGVLRPGGYRPPTLAQGQEVCLFLAQHPEGTFYTLPAYFSVIDKKAPTFEKDVAEAKKDAKLLDDPGAGLESKDAPDRFLTAAMLVARYRQRKPSATPPAQEPIDAGESKRILQALADADWTPPNKPVPSQLTPQNAFNLLGLTAKDGWTPPKDFKQFPDEAKKWLKENADKYRIERFVADEKKAEKKD